MKNYAEVVKPNATPQTEAIPGRESDMVRMASGGMGFAVDCWTQLDRFLLLGSCEGHYYTSGRDLTKQNIEALRACLAADGPRLVRRTVQVSEAGRAPKNEPAILALALAAKCGDALTRRAALEALPRVCRMGTHLFAFCEALQLFGGWGRGTKRAVGTWYRARAPRDLAYQITKYQQRNGWTHRDVLRLSHPPHGGHNAPVLRYAARGVWPNAVYSEEPLDLDAGAYLKAVLALQALGEKRAPAAGDLVLAAELIRDHRLPREVVPSAFLNSALVWEALLEDMPTTALLRNLATMTRVGLLAPLNAGARRVCERLRDGTALKNARIHPIQVLMALRTYAAGRGLRGQHTWEPVPQIVEALDDAFYLAFASVEPIGSRLLTALDVSGSMSYGSVGGVLGLSPREASAALALVMASTEPEHHIVAFSHEIVPLDIRAGMRLDQATRAVGSLPFGRTDVAQPLLWALQNKVECDTVVVITDNESYFNPDLHPCQALERYRQEMGRSTRLVCCAMTATDYSVADPSDAGMLDICGFDSAVPELIATFARGDTDTTVHVYTS